MMTNKFREVFQSVRDWIDIQCVWMMGFQPTSFFWGEFLRVPSNLRGGGWKPFSPFQLAKPASWPQLCCSRLSQKVHGEFKGQRSCKRSQKQKQRFPGARAQLFRLVVSNDSEMFPFLGTIMENDVLNETWISMLQSLMLSNIIEYHLISSNIYMRCNIYIYISIIYIYVM